MDIIEDLAQAATWRIGLKLLVAIVGIELLIMVALAALRLDADSWWVGVGDALVLGLCSSALIYFWVVRPLKQAKQQNDLFQTVVNTLPAGVVVTDYTRDEHAIISVNPAFTHITGYREEEVLGRHPRLLQGEDADKTALERTRKAMQEQRPVHVLQRNRRKDGSLFWNELYLSPIMDAHGRATRWVGLVHDVTQRKELEDEVRRLAHAVEQAEEAVCTFDVEGRIDFCNPAFCRNVGLEMEDVRGQVVWMFWPENDEITETARQAVADERVWSGRHRRLRADGSEYEALISLSPVRDEHGVLIRYSALHRDISDMVEFEREMMRAQRMEAMGTLTGGIAHDFNNMLAGMLGHLYLMKKAVQDKPRVLDRIQTIEEQGHRAADLVRQLLTFARKSDVERKPFDMRPFAKEIVRFIEPVVPENIRLMLEIADAPMPVEGDAGQIQQCILNLVVNARHAIEDRAKEEGRGFRGEIRLMIRLGIPKGGCDAANRFCEPSKICPESCVEVRVEDNGCGISPALRERIFEPYFTTKQANRGTGLGLSMVQGCVEMHHGCIQVESEPGRGSVFSLFFPVMSHEEEGVGVEEAADTKLPPGRGCTVLVADDDHSMRDVLKEVLEEADYRVLVADSGEEAVDIFQKHRDVICMAFVDKVMPGRDGLEVVRHIHMSRPDVGLVLMSGYEMADTLLQDPLVLAGVMHLMRKPWRMDELARLLGSMAENSDRQGPEAAEVRL